MDSEACLKDMGDRGIYFGCSQACVPGASGRIPVKLTLV